MSNEYLDIAMNKVITQEVNKVLDKIRAEITDDIHKCNNIDMVFGMQYTLDIIDKYRAESENKSCLNCKYWLLDKNDENRKCKYCFEMDEWAAESEKKE